MLRSGPCWALLLACCLAGCRTAKTPPTERSAAASTPDTTPVTATDTRPVLVFLGTSLTAGYGLDAREAYPSLIQHKLDSLGLGYRVVNAGVSGATSADGLSTLDWVLSQNLPISLLVVELGANDGLRGNDAQQTIASLRENLLAIAQKARARYPSLTLVLAGMTLPPNFGDDFVARFEAVYPEVAKATGATLIPFLLENVGGVRALNQADGIHPTAAGQRIVAENVWRVVRPLLER
ncbi:MAG: arylesterase [Bacteroidia bacterium]|nr:arylesterase [Bacteroidia bacterium]